MSSAMSKQQQARAFAGQFVLSQDPAFIPPAWNLHEKGAWVLATHPSLPVADICTSEQSHLGWIIGYPIAGAAINPGRVVFPAESKDHQELIEARLYQLGGRFVAIILTDTLARVYLDACGSLAAVYSSKLPVVASTPSLIDDREHEWDAELRTFLRMPESGLWYPFGLTSRKHVERLLPNHFLDLSSWSVQRHWPNRPSFSSQMPIDEGIRAISDRVQQHIAATARTYPLHMSLTAGRDSRMLLACAREHTERIVFFTFVRDRDTADAQIARRLAKRFGFSHIQLSIETASAEQRAAWLQKTGYCISGEIWKIHPTLRHLDPARALLPGMAGEVGRGYFWHPGDREGDSLQPADAVARCHLPANQQIVAKASAWLAEVADLPIFTILDLLYIEQRLGCWGGPQQYGGDGWSACQLFPLAHRAIFEAILRLPIEYRRDARLALDMCRTAWPELLDLPFNEFAGWQRYPRRMAKSLLRLGRRALGAMRAKQ